HHRPAGRECWHAGYAGWHGRHGLLKSGQPVYRHNRTPLRATGAVFLFLTPVSQVDGICTGTTTADNMVTPAESPVWAAASWYVTQARLRSWIPSFQTT